MLIKPFDIKLASSEVIVSGFAVKIYSSENSELYRFTAHHPDPVPGLPHSFVIKVHCDEECLNVESSVYTRLRPMQGLWIPRCYGEMEIITLNKRGLALEEIKGKTIHKLAYQSQEPERLRWSDFITSCFTKISNYGVHVGDDNLGNVISADDGRLVLVDFGFSKLCDSELCLRRNSADAESMALHFEWIAEQRLEDEAHEAMASTR